MNIREISDVFKDTADEITAIKSYNFGWASDRVRQGNTEDFQELNEFPRVFFAVPTITASDQTRKQDTYQVTLFFDDLLGYDNEGDEDPTLQIDKWANLQQYANYFIQRLNKIKQSILPNYLFIPEAPSITFDSFTGIQRMITVQLSFNLVVPTNCDPGVITLVQCIANIVTSSNLTASLTTVLKFSASLEGRATVTADINFVQKVASSLNAFGTLTGDINFVQKVQASLLTSANVTGDITIPKLLNASLLATGTTTADLTVQSAASLLLDLYPNAAAAYSLRKLRTAYTGSAIRVRRSSDNTEQDIGFVSDQLDTVSILSFCGAGNGFVTTWYDQSGNAINATQTTQANQPQIVSNGSVINQNSKATIQGDGINYFLRFNMGATTVPVSTFYCSKRNSGTGYAYEWALGRAGWATALSTMSSGWFLTSQNAFAWSGNTVHEDGSQSLNTFYLKSMLNLISGTRLLFFINNVNRTIGQPSGTISTDGNGAIFADGSVNNTQRFSGIISELIFYKSDQTSNVNGINTNINSYYGIY